MGGRPAAVRLLGIRGAQERGDPTGPSPPRGQPPAGAAASAGRRDRLAPAGRARRRKCGPGPSWPLLQRDAVSAVLPVGAAFPSGSRVPGGRRLRRSLRLGGPRRGRRPGRGGQLLPSARRYDAEISLLLGTTSRDGVWGHCSWARSRSRPAGTVSRGSQQMSSARTHERGPCSSAPVSGGHRSGPAWCTAWPPCRIRASWGSPQRAAALEALVDAVVMCGSG
jgi:hypothetical protein